MSVEEGATNFENNTTSESFSGGIGRSREKRLVNNSSWIAGLQLSGVENLDDLPDNIWSDQWNEGWGSFSSDEERVATASENYENNSTAESWQEGWGDASDWDV